MYKQELAQRREQEFVDRMNQLVNDPKLRDKYFSQIREQITALESNTKEFYDLVNSQIQKIFQNAYLEKLQLVHDRSKEAHNLEKRRMFIRFKKFLFQSRILSY